MALVFRVQGDDLGGVFSQTLPIGALTQVRQTPEQIAMLAPVQGGINPNTVATVRYREPGGDWADAHPLYRRDPGGANDAFVGIIFDLDPGKSYAVEVTYNDGASVDIRGQSLHGLFTTRALPPTAGPPDETPSTLAQLTQALNNLDGIGGVIELQDATYPLGAADYDIDFSGTPSNPIYIRGKSIDGVVFTSTGGEINIGNGSLAEHIVLENFTFIGGGGVDSRAFVLGNSGSGTNQANNITIRDIISTNTFRAVQTAGGTTGGKVNSILVYNCDFTGLEVWNTATINTSSFSSDGLRLVGHSNCAFQNTLEAFSDSVTFAHSPPAGEPPNTSECNYAYRNFIRNSLDDTFELDRAQGFIGIYDNYCENVSTCWSQSDLSNLLGPIYIFRNSFVNFEKRMLKPNATWYGWHVYSNTFIRADTLDGSPYVNGIGCGWFDANASHQDRFAYRNNIFIYRGTKARDPGAPGAPTRYLWRIRFNDGGAGTNNTDVSHNAFFPSDIAILWNNDLGEYANLSAAIADAAVRSPLYPAAAGLGAPTTRYDATTVACESDPFVDGPTLGADGLTNVTGAKRLTIAAATAPKNAGVAIPGITNGYSGAAPDMGAEIAGRSPVTYGRVQTVLSQQAASIGAGQSTNMPISSQNPLTKWPAEVHWQTICHYDPARKEIQYMGGPFFSQTPDHQHYIYDEVTNVWRTTGQALFPSQGHIWTTAFDTDGDFYFKRDATDQHLKWMRRSVEAGQGATNNPWSTTANTSAVLASSPRRMRCGAVWHPNLFGAGDGGVAIRCDDRILGWRKATNTYHDIWVFGLSQPYSKKGNGTGLYLPQRDEAILGTGRASDGPDLKFLFVTAGSGGSPGTGGVRSTANTPVEVSGKSSSGTACILLHPNNDDRILMLENANGNRVWQSTNGGATFTAAGFTHPFGSGMASQVNNSAKFTCAPYGVIGAVSSHLTGSPTFRLWKPNN